MAAKDRLETFFANEAERLVEGEEHVFGGCAAVFLIVLGAFAFGPVPISRLQIRGVVRASRPGAGGAEAEAGWRHQPLLRGGNGQVDSPLVHREGQARERRHRVDEEQRIVASGVEGRSDGGEVVDDSGGRIDVDDQHGFDAARRVRAQ